MTPHGFTEDQLCEQPALQVLAALGWQTVSATDEVFGPGGTFGRETPSDAVLSRGSSGRSSGSTRSYRWKRSTQRWTSSPATARQ
jgi:hypothetical protein